MSAELSTGSLLQNRNPSQSQLEIARALKVDPLIIQMAELRNYKGVKSISSYLFPSLTQLPDPFSMLGMKEAAGIVFAAITNETEIVIWGDYDVDGVTGTCLLVTFFHSLRVNVKHHVPDRFNEGYGLNCEKLQQIRNELSTKRPLLITVDCGISNVEEVEFAKTLGFEVIVTDHHEPGGELPAADAILNPKQFLCSFPEKNIAGVGVAFYLAAGVRSILKENSFFNKLIKEPNLKEFLSLVAVGTIADIVPLTGTNRVLVRAGFESLVTTEQPGINALLNSCDIVNPMITADDIAFQLAPKINAAGRMGNADIAVRLLLSNDVCDAEKLAVQLTRINKNRKKKCQDILETTLDMLDNPLYMCDNCIVMAGDFHLGVVGIVASQLVESQKVPTILLTEVRDISGKSVLKGSGRSYGNIDLYDCLDKCKDLLIKFGGHKMAAGLSLEKANFEAFKIRFSDTLTENSGAEQVLEKNAAELMVDIEKLFSEKMLKQYLLLEPFGEGNKQLRFRVDNPRICKSQQMGRSSEHLKITVRGKYANHEAIGFGLGHKLDQLKERENNHIVFTPMVSRFKKNIKWKAKIIDIV